MILGMVLSDDAASLFKEIKVSLATYKMKAGDSPVVVFVNISGCNIIRIEPGRVRAFYKVTQTTAN